MRYFLLFLLIYISCNNLNKSQPLDTEIKVSKQEVEKNIAILRKCGFFADMITLSDQEVFDQLHSNRIAVYSKIFEKTYDPGMNLDEFELACLDNHKMIYIDLEADVCAENKVYKDVILMFSNISDGKFIPKNIKESWHSDSGPISVEFELDNEIINFNPKFSDDWLDQKVFEICRKQIEAKGLRIVECLGESEFGYGQAISFMKLTDSQQTILEKNYRYKFRE
ncbi:hypothetical protein [Flavobacterium selenitireducens]|uniref:hypothetical protein n=1 Tax=Flavobacterium selenitireducens TaxID=2722704 RepID=UPI00168B873E|nr:hypothetical protein [Flavobacterium selenitireducens]MBD3584096.1 hypothetical protein [Flavobacterium selenitireducens]